MAKLELRRAMRPLLLAAALATALAGCVSTRVSSSVVGPQHRTIDRVIVLAQPGSFGASNIAGNLGQRNLDRLAPSLQARVPADLSLNGLQARWWQDGATQAPGEAVLILVPVSAAWNSRTGQTLVLRATLQDALYQRPIWTAEITMKTLSFASWGDGVADDIATQLVERLRADHLLRGDGAIKVAAAR